MPRLKDEKPTKLIADAAQLPLHCDGNGNKHCQSHAPTCAVSIKVKEPIFMAHWKTSPHLTVHCRACRAHFFTGQRALL